MLGKLFFMIYTYLFGNIPPYITTDYLYSDYFENIICNNKCVSHYTEGEYSNFVPFNTRDTSAENYYKIQEWCIKKYNESLENTSDPIFNMNIMKKVQDQKYKWFIDNLNIKKNDKVLEIGFGKIEFMKYIRDNTGATVEGMNISQQQIDYAEEEGFKCYKIQFDDIDKNIDVLSKYDAIITNGSFEYVVNHGDTNEKYNKIINSIKNI